MKYLATISFDGTEYFGWSYQKNRPTIQGDIEKALKKIFKYDVKTFGCSRTDKGVHASIFYFDFSLKFEIENIKKIIEIMNAYLGNNILISNIKKIPDSQITRYNVISKTYRYSFVKNYSSFYEKKYCTILKWKNINKYNLQKAINVFIGKHDFSSFSTTDNKDKNNVREIYSFYFVINDNKESIDFFIKGSGFLHHMIRKILYILELFLNGELSIKEIEDILMSKNYDNVKGIKEPNGLHLVEISLE